MPLWARACSGGQSDVGFQGSADGRSAEQDTECRQHLGDVAALHLVQFSQPLAAIPGPLGHRSSWLAAFCSWWQTLQARVSAEVSVWLPDHGPYTPPTCAGKVAWDGFRT